MSLLLPLLASKLVKSDPKLIKPDTYERFEKLLAGYEKEIKNFFVKYVEPIASMRPDSVAKYLDSIAEDALEDMGNTLNNFVSRAEASGGASSQDFANWNLEILVTLDKMLAQARGHVPEDILNRTREGVLLELIMKSMRCKHFKTHIPHFHFLNC